MPSWQKSTRLVLGLIIVAVVVAVALALHRRSAPPPGATKAAVVAPNAVVTSTNGANTEFSGARETFRVKYQQQVTYSDGSTKLEGVTVNVDNRGGRSFVVTGTEGQVGSGHSSVTLTGRVHVQVSDGLQLDTSSMIYTQGDGMVRTGTVPVTFRRGGMSGHSVGMTYDKNNDILTLVKDAVIHVAPDAHGQNGADVNAGSAEFVRRNHMLILSGVVHLTRGSETVDADAATAYLTDDDKSLSMLNLRGHSRIAGVAATAGGLRGLQANDIDLEYRPGGGAIQQASLMGSARLAVAGTTVKADRQIVADTLTIEIGPDGSTVTQLTGKGHVALVLPPEGQTPRRTIHADDLGANAGPDGGGLSAAQFVGHVEYREALEGGDRLARAGALDLTLAPGLGDLRQADFSRGVRITENDVQATSATARYDVAKGTMALAGAGPDGGSGPHVVDARIIVDAEAVTLTPDGPSLDARGQVRSVLKPAGPGQTGHAGEAPIHRPAILKADQPVNVTSDALVYNGPDAHAVYTGQARLWHGDTAIQGQQLTLDDRTGNLTATGNVRTTMLVTQQDDKTKKPGRSLVVAQAQNLQYDDSARRATYTTRAHLNGPDGDLTGDRIELYLSPGGDQVERLEGYDHITLRQPRRVVTGERLSYFEVDERYLVTGAPVKIDTVDQKCNETLGKSLTFWKSTDRIVVDGGGSYRTETRSGGSCSGAPGR